MEYDKNKIYKVVYNDEKIKAPRGQILESNEIYLVMQFKDSSTLSINHKQIISISEVADVKQ